MHVASATPPPVAQATQPAAPPDGAASDGAAGAAEGHRRGSELREAAAGRGPDRREGQAAQRAAAAASAVAAARRRRGGAAARHAKEVPRQRPPGRATEPAQPRRRCGPARRLGRAGAGLEGSGAAAALAQRLVGQGVSSVRRSVRSPARRPSIACRWVAITTVAKPSRSRGGWRRKSSSSPGFRTSASLGRPSRAQFSEVRPPGAARGSRSRRCWWRCVGVRPHVPAIAIKSRLRRRRLRRWVRPQAVPLGLRRRGLLRGDALLAGRDDDHVRRARRRRSRSWPRRCSSRIWRSFRRASRGFSARLRRTLGTPRPAARPAVWVATEMGRTYIWDGFPWELLGYSQVTRPADCAARELVGVYGLSALVALVSAALRVRRARRRRARAGAPAVVVGARRRRRRRLGQRAAARASADDRGHADPRGRGAGQRPAGTEVGPAHAPTRSCDATST